MGQSVDSMLVSLIINLILPFYCRIGFGKVDQTEMRIFGYLSVLQKLIF